MSDVYIPDPDRMIVDCSIGNVQAWKPLHKGGTAIALSFFASLDRYKDAMESYTSSSLNLTIADVRSIAETLLRAADHAEALVAKDAAE